MSDVFDSIDINLMIQNDTQNDTKVFEQDHRNDQMTILGFALEMVTDLEL